MKGRQARSFDARFVTTKSAGSRASPHGIVLQQRATSARRWCRVRGAAGRRVGHRPLFTLSDFDPSGLSRAYSRPLIFTTCAPGCRSRLISFTTTLRGTSFRLPISVVLITPPGPSFRPLMRVISLSFRNQPAPGLRVGDKFLHQKQVVGRSLIRAGFSQENRPEDILPQYCEQNKNMRWLPSLESIHRWPLIRIGRMKFGAQSTGSCHSTILSGKSFPNPHFSA